MAHASGLVIFLSDQHFFLTHQKRILTINFFKYRAFFEKRKIVKNNLLSAFLILPPKRHATGILQRSPWDLWGRPDLCRPGGIPCFSR